MARNVASIPPLSRLDRNEILKAADAELTAELKPHLAKLEILINEIRLRVKSAIAAGTNETEKSKAVAVALLGQFATLLERDLPKISFSANLELQMPAELAGLLSVETSARFRHA